MKLKFGMDVGTVTLHLRYEVFWPKKFRPGSGAFGSLRRRSALSQFKWFSMSFFATTIGPKNLILLTLVDRYCRYGMTTRSTARKISPQLQVSPKVGLNGGNRRKSRRFWRISVVFDVVFLDGDTH